MEDTVKHCSSLGCSYVASYGDRCLGHLRPRGRTWKVSIPVEDADFRDIFWMNVRRSDPDSCWLWLGARAPNGYGHLRVDGRTVGAHRVSLELKLGRPIGAGLYACHSCDNPLCCNPDHLREGTHLENDHDRRDRLRGGHGETHPDAKLTDYQVQQIRLATANGAWQLDLARHFGVTLAAVNSAVLRKTWKHVPDDPTVDISALPRPRRLRAGVTNPKSKMTPDQVRNIRERWRAGKVSQQELADEYGVHQTTISSIVRQQTWTD